MMHTSSYTQNPYVGPRPFQTGETLYGRDREILELLDLLIAERIVLLYSPSGAGKTSLIQAGLLPKLEEELADYRDSRGLARALTGDSKGAIEDFRFFAEKSSCSPFKVLI